MCYRRMDDCQGKAARGQRSLVVRSKSGPRPERCCPLLTNLRGRIHDNSRHTLPLFALHVRRVNENYRVCQCKENSSGWIESCNMLCLYTFNTCIPKGTGIVFDSIFLELLLKTFHLLFNV